jgi:hypothetical protein
MNPSLRRVWSLQQDALNLPSCRKKLCLRNPVTADADLSLEKRRRHTSVRQNDLPEDNQRCILEILSEEEEVN